LKTDDLDGLKLGYTFDNTITLDNNAAGHGWFVDRTPHQDQEFHEYSKSNVSGLAYINSEASGRMDLLTVVSHEIGHILGFKHGEFDLMDDTLEAGVRITPVINTDLQLSSSHAINSVINKSPVSENKSFSYKLKEKLSYFGGVKFFDDYKGGFSSHTSETDDEERNDFLMFSNTEYDKEKQDKDSRYEITEHDADENFESFELADEGDTAEGEETIRESALIDWSAWEDK